MTVLLMAGAESRNSAKRPLRSTVSSMVWSRCCECSQAHRVEAARVRLSTTTANSFVAKDLRRTSACTGARCNRKSCVHFLHCVCDILAVKGKAEGFEWATE